MLGIYFAVRLETPSCLRSCIFQVFSARLSKPANSLHTGAMHMYHNFLSFLFLRQVLFKYLYYSEWRLLMWTLMELQHWHHYSPLCFMLFPMLVFSWFSNQFFNRLFDVLVHCCVGSNNYCFTAFRTFLARIPFTLLFPSSLFAMSHSSRNSLIKFCLLPLHDHAPSQLWTSFITM